MYDRYRDKGLAFLSVSVTWDNEGDARKFVEQYRLPFPVGRDASGLIGGKYGVDTTPKTFFIGKDGKIVERVDGGMDEAGLDQRIQRLLAG